MKIDRVSLETALSRVKPGLEKGKEYIEQMKHVLFDGEDIATYNDHIAVLFPFETEFQTSVRFEDLYKAVTSTLSGAEIEVEMKEEKKQLILKSDGTKVGLVTTEVDELGGLLESLKNQLPEEPDDWMTLPKDFLQAVNLCIFSASSNMMLGPLTCIHVTEDSVASSDNFRVSLYQFQSKMKGVNFLISAADAKELVNFPVTHMHVGESWINFTTADNIVFSTRLVQHEPLDLKSTFIEFEGAKIVFPEETKEKLESMLFLSAGDTQLEKAVDMIIDEGKILCKSSNDRGWVEKEIEIDYKGRKKELCINPIFLSQILSETTIATIGTDRTLLESGSFKHTLMHKVGIETNEE